MRSREKWGYAEIATDRKRWCWRLRLMVGCTGEELAKIPIPFITNLVVRKTTNDLLSENME